MHKKPETHEIDIPVDDIECWEKYPKHRWVYELSRLLDSQSVKWSPYEVHGFSRELNIEMYSVLPMIRQPGYIYVCPHVDAMELLSEVYIAKGEIKLIRHIDISTNKELDYVIGEIELRLNAFVTLHFSKFTGVITARTIGNNIFRVQLRPYAHVISDTNAEAFKLKKRLYKRNAVTLNGLTDQALHETLAS